MLQNVPSTESILKSGQIWLNFATLAKYLKRFGENFICFEQIKNL